MEINWNCMLHALPWLKHPEHHDTIQFQQVVWHLAAAFVCIAMGLHFMLGGMEGN